MNDFQFCYWLQGILEVLEPSHLDSNQVKCVKEHLDLVEQKQLRFTNWLDGYMSANTTPEWDATVLKTIQKQLSAEFIKTIDPSYPDEIQESLYNAHSGIKPTGLQLNPSEMSELIRC